jgi:TonB family protein
MTLEVQRVSGPSENGFGSLSSCFVEGDPQSEKRARRIKQRAVAISILLQSFALVALVLFPLLSKGERISLKDATPIPPYARIGNHRVESNPRPHPPVPCHFCPKISAPTTVVSRDPTPPTESSGPDGDPKLGFPKTPGIDGGYTPPNARPVAPPEVKTPVIRERQKVSEMQQMAQLINRVEPRYPAIAIQIHREGRVELHAFISTTGTIESLEVLSGDPLFIQSALAAVREWRYRPTILNGHPVEVDTHITVIYTLSH